MSDPRVAADIGHYVAQKVRASPKFRGWPPWLCDEVQSALAVGAKGMFRWAVCQLDILRRINDIGSIRAALRDLPETLDDTYIRIFSHTNIHKADWRLLRHTLRMISFHNATKSIHVSEITDSGVISTYMAFNECGPSPTADHLYTPRLLEEICDCLVTFRDDSSSSRRYATFAHYTVREFIESDRCASSPAAFFRSPPHEVEWDIITSSIGQLGGAAISLRFTGTFG